MMRKGSVNSMKYKDWIIEVVLMLAILFAIGYGAGYIADTIYRQGNSDAITLVR